jgi:hypothetical protein
MREVRGASEARAITLQFRAVLCHAPSWVVDDRIGLNKKTDRRRRARPPLCGRLAVSAHLASSTSNTGITQDRAIPQVLPGSTWP